MKQEAAQELIDRQAHHALPVAVRGVPPPECDIAIGEGKQPVVRDGDAMRVGAKVTQNVLRTTERRLGIDDPVLAEQSP